MKYYYTPARMAKGRDGWHWMLARLCNSQDSSTACAGINNADALENILEVFM